MAGSSCPFSYLLPSVSGSWTGRGLRALWARGCVLGGCAPCVFPCVFSFGAFPVPSFPPRFLVFPLGFSPGVAGGRAFAFSLPFCCSAAALAFPFRCCWLRLACLGAAMGTDSARSSSPLGDRARTVCAWVGEALASASPDVCLVPQRASAVGALVGSWTSRGGAQMAPLLLPLLLRLVQPAGVVDRCERP